MSEIRKPVAKLLLKNPGKKDLQIEIFPANLWKEKLKRGNTNFDFALELRFYYRIRANGKWSQPGKFKYHFYKKYEIRDILWRHMNEIDFWSSNKI